MCGRSGTVLLWLCGFCVSGDGLRGRHACVVLLAVTRECCSRRCRGSGRLRWILRRGGGRGSFCLSFLDLRAGVQARKVSTIIVTIEVWEARISSQTCTRAASAAYLRKGRPRLLHFEATRLVQSIKDTLTVLLHIIYASFVGVESTEKKRSTSGEEQG